MQTGFALDALTFAVAGAPDGLDPFVGAYLQQQGLAPATTGLAMGLARRPDRHDAHRRRPRPDRGQTHGIDPGLGPHAPRHNRPQQRHAGSSTWAKHLTVSAPRENPKASIVSPGCHMPMIAA